ncbi:phage tail protein [Ensifer sp. ENS10]|uniref:phage tail protein n=1 Tax=Ensifer sp. ENS10 TaxID=2769286 RepID=UPI00177EC20F|nr:tail fiber protein [Ensifer sp. ENS10]MBD9512039.1 phage tail protein [Ensifer sp. ENS10]
MSTPYVGEIRMFGFSKVPNGWFACDGSLHPISQYDVLFTLIGTTYGGDGQLTFAVPNLSGRVPVHNGSGQGLTPRVIGQLGGSENITLLVGQIPAHSHSMNATSVAAEGTTIAPTAEFGSVTGDTLYVTDTSGSARFATSSASTDSRGSTQPHDNTMPTLSAQFCIAWAGVFPSQG